MKLISYHEALKMGKDAVKEMLIPHKVSRMRKTAELEACKLDEEIARKEDELQTACSNENLDFKRIIALQDDLALLLRRKRQYNEILEQMFPEENK